MSYESVLIAGAANTVSHGVQWVKLSPHKEFIAFAMSNLVAITDPSIGIVCTLRGHSGRINAITSAVINNCIYLFSAGDDGKICSYKHCYSDSIIVWEQLGAVAVMTSAATTIDCITLSNGIVVVSSDSSGNIRAWSSHKDSTNTFTEVYKHKLPPSQIAHNLHFAKLPSAAEERLLLCVGSVDSRIHLYQVDVEMLFNTVHDTTVSSTFVVAGVLVGHEEWVTCFSSIIVSDSVMMLASASQDCKIRVWKVCIANARVSQVKATALNGDGEDEDEIEVVEELDELTSEVRLQFELLTGTAACHIFLESLLVGHEDWVTSIHWMPNPESNSKGLRLFSTSMDRNMVIWSEDQAAGGVWSPKVRVGDIGGALGGSIGGNLLGFVGGCLCPSGNSLLGIGYGGSFHRWVKVSQEIVNEESEDRWQPISLHTGHFLSVNDVCWSVNKKYLVSVSSDQTCRLWAPTSTEPKKWIEVSRPEIHGYDLNCVALDPYSYQIFTAGEEKLLRLFDAPKVVVNGLDKLCGISEKDVIIGEARSNRYS